MSGTRWARAVLFRAVAAAFGLALAAATAEIACRLLAGRWLDLRHPTVEFDPELGWVQRRGVTDTRVNEAGQPVVVEGSPMGIRARPGGAARPGGVLVVGDSFVAGTQLPYPETWVAQMEARLRRHHGQIDVVNAGVDRYDLSQAFRLAERLRPGLRPRHVVVAVYLGNDLIDYGCCGRARPPWERGTPSSWIKEHSYAYHVAASSADVFRGGRDEGPRDEGREGADHVPASVPGFLGLRPDQQARIRGQFVSADLLPALGPGAEAERRLRSTARVLEVFAAVAEETCEGLTVLLLPTKQQVIPAQRAEWLGLHGLTGEDADRPAAFLRAWGERAGARVVDLAPLLRADPRPERLFWPVDLHWSAAGHARVGEAVGGIVEEGLASTPPGCRS